MINKAVYSFWSKPSKLNGGLKVYHCRWKDPLLHFCGWIISIFQTRQHYDAVEFVTDSRGAKAFVDSLDLPFTSVKVALDDLDHVAPAMWMTGKLKQLLKTTT
jgi:hypothetical protein